MRICMEITCMPTRSIKQLVIHQESKALTYEGRLKSTTNKDGINKLMRTLFTYDVSLLLVVWWDVCPLLSMYAGWLHISNSVTQHTLLRLTQPFVNLLINPTISSCTQFETTISVFSCTNLLLE